MSIHEQAAATNRMRRALLAFEAAKATLLTVYRRRQGPAEVEGDQVKATLRLAATETDAAFQAFSVAGLVASAEDQRLITDAQRYLADGKT